MGMANLRMIEGCWPCVTKSDRERIIKLEPAIEIWGTNSEGICWRELLGSYGGGKEDGEE
jgi:hypothetical protein